MKKIIKYVLQSRPKVLDPVHSPYSSWQDQTIDESLERIQILFKIGTHPDKEYRVVRRIIKEFDEVIQ